jgi:HlyD family secretion protein
MSGNKKWWIVAGVVVVVGLGLGGWQLIVSQQDAVAEAQGSTETVVVRRDTLVVTVEGTGSLAPHAEVSLAFDAGGRVAEVLVEEEQVVEVGQPLVRLETDELALQVAQAETVLASAEGQLAQLLAAPQPEEVAAQEANLAAMQGQVSAAVANRDQVTGGPSEAQIAAAQVQVASAEMDYKAAVINYDRTDKNDEDRKEQARYDLWAADVALAAARTQLDDLLAGADTDEVRAAQANVANAVAQRDAAQAQLDLLLAGPTAEQVQAAEAAVDQARVSLDRARLSLEQATLTAPMGGTITSLGVELGEMVSPGQPVVVLSGLTELEVEVNLDETDVARVAVGQSAQVSVDAFPGVEMNGEVTYIAPKADVASGVVLFPVTVRLIGQALPVRAGMTADVEITTASREDALIVPLRAVHIEDGLAYVERVVGDQIERVAVTLGLTTDTEAEITRGLSEGDVVSVVAASTQSSTMPAFGPGRVFRGGN